MYKKKKLAKKKHRKNQMRIKALRAESLLKSKPKKRKLISKRADINSDPSIDQKATVKKAPAKKATVKKAPAKKAAPKKKTGTKSKK